MDWIGPDKASTIRIVFTYYLLNKLQQIKLDETGDANEMQIEISVFKSVIQVSIQKNQFKFHLMCIY